MDHCERCPATTPPSSYALMDYCANCSANLCDDCMASGCCGETPARSGAETDSG